MTNRWIIGARPRTLPAAVVPVVVGTAVAAHDVNISWWKALLTLIVALAVQIGTNYANDYSDGIRGTDAKRVGPIRLVASGMAAPGEVRRAAMLSFLICVVAGLILAATVSWWLLAVGAAAIAAGWFYTGGKRPYGYSGYGELFVFVFFGLVAVQGTAYVQTKDLLGVGWFAAAAVGLLAVALLVVNNLRDIPGDTEANKKTLAVRMGDRTTRLFYLDTVLVPFLLALIVAIVRPWTLLVLIALPLTVLLVRPILAKKEGRDLIAVLQGTARLQLAFGLLFSIGLAL